jgi:hypothetical protein
MAGGCARWRTRVSWLLAGIGLSWGPVGCAGDTAPERVADHFTDAYFRRMDPQAARSYAALGAGEMLDREIDLARSVRDGAPVAAAAVSDVAVRRAARSVRGERVRMTYEIAFGGEGGETKRSADLELARMDATWKVVKVDVKAR